MKTVIFDLDGTILDTLPDLKDSINAMLDFFGYKTLTAEEVKKTIGSGARRLVADSLPEPVSEERLDECLKKYTEIYYSSGSPKTKVFSGMDKVLQTLKARGYKLAVLSNKPQLSTDQVCEKYLKDFGFDMIVGQSESVRCKPDPAGAQYIMRSLGAGKEETFLVGDGETDVLTAINAGVKGVGALWGNRTKEDLIAAGCKTFAEYPEQLLDVIL